MSNDILKYISDKLEERRLIQVDDVSLGKAKEFGDYKFSCGIIRGLLIAKNIIIETAVKLERDDD